MNPSTALAAPVALALSLATALGARAQEFAPLPGFERLRGVTAVAVDSTGARVAVGTRASVWLAARGETAQRALRAGEVRDLAFAPDGALWVASERGLFEIAGTVATPQPLAPGAGGRATRVLWLGPTLLIGSEDGLSLRAPTGAIARANGSLPEGAVRALAALGPRSALAVIGAEVAHVTLDAAGEHVASVARETLPAGDGAPLDLAALGHGEALVLRESGLAHRDATGAWRRVALLLPPGATPVRLLARDSGVWIGTDSGALFARGAAGPFERASAPAGGAAVTALAASAEGLLLAGPRGVLHATERLRLPAARDAAHEKIASAPLREPSVLAVQRAALRNLALEPQRIASLRDRPRRSALAPALELFGGVGGDRSHQRDWDETVSSGVDRVFFDRQRDRGRDYDAGVRLSWNLGGAVFHPEEIDASREAREWIELRDEVLDEVGQLYFERRRALLDAARESDPYAAARLGLRAAELAAGLDAWTGGWWSAQAEHASPEGPASEITP